MLNRREYLFLYDVSFGNPNGDPNDENKPRIDEETGRNIITDVRLKRTVRDYLYDFKGMEIFVREIKEGEYVIDGKKRASMFGNNPENIINSCIDIRLFGGVIPLEKKNNNKKEKKEETKEEETTEDTKSGSIKFTGPVQFNMGQSLHKVKLEYIKGTGAFASKKEKTTKTFREEWILPYSLIAFHGVFNENASKHTKTTEKDLEHLREVLWYGTKNLITRSKMEHIPRLLIEIVYKPNTYFHIGELHRYVKIETNIPEEHIRSTDDFILNIDRLIEVIEEEKDKIEKVNYKVDRNLRLSRDLKSDLVEFQEIKGI